MPSAIRRSTTSRPQPSISSGMVPRPVMASTTKMASVFGDRAAHGATSCAAPVEVSDACTKTPLVAGSASSAASTCSGLTTCAVGHGDHVGVQAVGLGDLGPALAEFSGDADDHFVAAREEVGHGGVHGAGAGSGEHQHIVRRAHDFLEVRQTRTVDLAEILGAVMNVATPSWRAARADRGASGPELINVVF